MALRGSWGVPELVKPRPIYHENIFFYEWIPLTSTRKCLVVILAWRVPARHLGLRLRLFLYPLAGQKKNLSVKYLKLSWRISTCGGFIVIFWGCDWGWLLYGQSKHFICFKVIGNMYFKIGINLICLTKYCSFPSWVDKCCGYERLTKWCVPSQPTSHHNFHLAAV